MNFLCQPLQDNSAIVGLARQKDILVLLEQLSSQKTGEWKAKWQTACGAKHMQHIPISWGGKLENPSKIKLKLIKQVSVHALCEFRLAALNLRSGKELLEILICTGHLDRKRYSSIWSVEVPST